MSIAAEFIEQASGDKLEGAIQFARGLMAGDKAQFKAGYTPDNAAWTVAEMFALEEQHLSHEDFGDLCVEIDVPGPNKLTDLMMEKGYVL